MKELVYCDNNNNYNINNNDDNDDDDDYRDDDCDQDSDDDDDSHVYDIEYDASAPSSLSSGAPSSLSSSRDQGSYKAVDVSGVAEDLMLMTRDNQALTSELLVVKDKMS